MCLFGRESVGSPKVRVSWISEEVSQLDLLKLGSGGSLKGGCQSNYVGKDKDSCSILKKIHLHGRGAGASGAEISL